MYIPKINVETDKTEIISFMKSFSFATIITSTNDLPVATHLPFTVASRENGLILFSHFAKANQQWRDIEKAKVLVIFSEPHAYISTRNYDNELNVPTWNYISIHAYGQGKIITDDANVLDILSKTIDTFETSYKKHWDNFPKGYKQKMLKGIVAFEIHVTDLQAKKKLSQNRSPNEIQKIIHTLSNSNNTQEILIAAYMKDSHKQPNKDEK